LHRHIFYKRVIPLGLNVLLHFIPSVGGVSAGRGGCMPSPSGKDRMGQKPEMLSLNLPKCPINVIPLGLNVLLHFIPSVGAGRGGFLIKTYKVFEDYRFMESQPSHQTLLCLPRRGRAAVHHSISIRSISFIKRAVSDKATIIF
jgi:hypothetical protein